MIELLFRQQKKKTDRQEGVLNLHPKRLKELSHWASMFYKEEICLARGDCCLEIVLQGWRDEELSGSIPPSFHKGRQPPL